MEGGILARGVADRDQGREICEGSKNAREQLDLVRAGRIDEAATIYRWFRPLLDLDVSTFLVQQIKLAEALAIGSTEHVRAPRLALTGDHRARVEALIRDRIACRPELPKLAA